MPRLDGDAMLTMPTIEAEAGLGMPQDERQQSLIAMSQEGSSSGKQESL
jgi:hypothetical protein